MIARKQTRENRAWKAAAIIMIAVLLAGLIGICILAEYGSEQYADNVLRLHVIANSNTSEDQALKLKVRNAVGSIVSELAAGASSAEETEQIVREHIDAIQAAAEEKIREEGYNYPVEIETGEYYFPTKYYTEGALPAGSYEAVRVVIGQGEGENWWCVLFPPLCFSNGTADPELDQEQQENEDVTLRFKIVEVFQEAKHSLSKFFQKIFK